MYTLGIQKYFILFNILATLSQHWPRWQQQHQQIATIIVSATSVKTTTTTTTSAAAIEAAVTRTTSASAFVDEVLPHNDSVATITSHAKAIDSSTRMARNENNNSDNNSDFDDFEQLVQRKLQEEAAMQASGASAAPDRLLSRKRRYLIFPEGSSFQLVYDGIYGVVDFTNYLILGITVALAWELPSKPQGEVIEEIANRLKDGRLPTRRNDTATDITYVDTNKNQTQVAKLQSYEAVKSSRPNYIELMSKINPAVKKTDYKHHYYTNAKGQLPAVFHAPMHQKYFYYKGSNKYDRNNSNYAKYQMLRRRRPTDFYYRSQVTMSPIGGNYRERPNDWRRKDHSYYVGSDKSKKIINSNNKSYNLSTFKVNPFNKWTEQKRRTSSLHDETQQLQGDSGGQYPWWNLATRLSNSLRRKAIPSRRIDSSQPLQRQRQQKEQQQQQQHQQQQKQPAASGFYRQPAATARKHRIYPVFGKRSIADEPSTAPATAALIHNNNNNNNNNNKNSSSSSNNNSQHHRHRRSGIIGPDLSRMERIHIRHHRSTRQTLYEKIEKYLDKLGIKNSHQCILRALCETGQKSHERSPGTFVGELMRAVFTMPEALNTDLLENRIQYKDQRYDRANVFDGSCTKEYALCQQSLWKTQFVK